MGIIPVCSCREPEKTPVYRVVLDPGHGGINIEPVEKYGDRYDRISKKYLEVFREGASYGNLDEHRVMYQTAEKVQHLLQKTETEEGWKEFSALVQKYSSVKPARIIIKSFLSRKESRTRNYLLSLKDPNADYRLFDFPDDSGNFHSGRISYINSLKPHLVVSLHCAQSAPANMIGMNAVICPPYSFMHQGLDVLNKVKSDPSFFYSSKYADWFEEKSTRSLYRWFLNDTAMYFFGYPLDGDDRLSFQRFKGYRHNMVTWAYSDAAGWEQSAGEHPLHSRYSSVFSGFVPDGAYWEREKSVYEEYRRGNGPEGYGGDNLYASNDIIRHVLTALSISGYADPSLRLSDPFISVWSVPLYINAISAYVELGYFQSPVYQTMFREKLDIVAEGIAVGIYSLLAGTESKAGDFPYKPRGKKLDLSKYTTTDNRSYFETVVK
jgi:hypothetical protein